MSCRFAKFLKDLRLIKYCGLYSSGRVNFYFIFEKVIRICEHIPVSYKFQEEPKPLIFENCM